MGVTGSNSLESVHFELENSDTIQADGYGFNLSYGTGSWAFVPPLPANYDVPTNPVATILTETDATNIYISLNGDTEADLKISLDEEPTDDTISFDINNPDELHIQDN